MAVAVTRVTVDLREHIRRRLLEAAERLRVTDDALARRAGVHPRTVRRVWAGESFGFRVADRLADALGVTWEAE